MFWSSHAFAQLMPPQASTFAGQIDALYEFLVAASVISCALVIGGMCYFAYKYRRKTDADKTAYIAHNTLLEFLWSFIPFVIFMVVFAWGWIVYHDMRTMPKNPIEIHVVGKQWSWDFVYKSGKRTTEEFYAPVGTPIKLIMSSQDVIHSFFIPSFRVKQDVVPGRYTALWFEATKQGTFQVFCTEYCGKSHSGMLARLHVVSKAAYEQWLQDNPYKGLTLAQIGEKVYSTKCMVCHNNTTAVKEGPGFAKLFGREENISSGQKVMVDENYIRESILTPAAKKVAGFEAKVMPPFQGAISEEELSGVIEYIKSLQ